MMLSYRLNLACMERGTAMYKENPQGKCPYCESLDHTHLALVVERYDRKGTKCNACGFYFVSHINGSKYPLIDKEDVNSDPGMTSN